MRDCKCVTELTQKLSDAADEVILCANMYYKGNEETPYRALISDLSFEHGFDERHIPLLIEMLAERTKAFEFEEIGRAHV